MRVFRLATEMSAWETSKNVLINLSAGNITDPVALQSLLSESIEANWMQKQFYGISALFTPDLFDDVSVYDKLLPWMA
jgi:hypothetical protein